MLRGGSPIGSLCIVRPDPSSFTERQITALQTFADQAVTAIENSRLFKERQTQSLHLGQGAVGHAAQIKQPVQIPDATAAGAYGGPLQEVIARAGCARSLPCRCRVGPRLSAASSSPETRRASSRPRPSSWCRASPHSRSSPSTTPTSSTTLCVPLLKDEESIGILIVTCHEERRFSPQEFRLIQTFADLGSVHAGLTKLRQSLFNLLSNAAKFTERGTITLAVARFGFRVPSSERRGACHTRFGTQASNQS